MENSERDNNILEAQELHRKVIEAGFDYGCLQVSLASLGARFKVEDVDRSMRKALSLSEVIEKTGLMVNWLVSTEEKLSAEAIEDLLHGRVGLVESHPDGEFLGFLWIETIPNQVGHALTIFLDEEDYLVMDTEVGGLLPVTAENLAHMGNRVLDQGGMFEIAQIRR